MLDEKQIKIIEKLDKEQQNKLIKILYYKTFIKWLNKNKGKSMKEDLLKIINHYGINKQLKYIHSEYFELDEAIMDYQNSGWDFDYEDAKELEEKYRQHIAEELADVMVMLKQFQYFYGLEDSQIEDIMKYKINRQLERIDKEC